MQEKQFSMQTVQWGKVCQIMKCCIVTNDKNTCSHMCVNMMIDDNWLG